MSELVKDFSRKFEYDQNGKLVKSGFELKVMNWNTEKHLVAYTFNSDSREFCEAFVEALKEFKTLVFITGVTGRTCNSCIQHQVYYTIKEMLGDNVSIEWDAQSGYSDAIYTLN